jgi:hypothetical protein
MVPLQSGRLMNTFMTIMITKEIILMRHPADFFKNYKMATTAPAANLLQCKNC